jgi:acetyl esterase/lipase
MKTHHAARTSAHQRRRCCAGWLLAASLFIATVAQAAPQAPLPLWPGRAPGSEHWTQVEVESLDLLPHRVVRNIVQPTLTPYPAPRDGNTGMAVVIAPGGGFKFLSIDTEGTEVAHWLNARGINAFLLKYRTDETPASEAIMTIQLAWQALVAILRGSDGYPRLPQTPVRDLAIADGMAAVALVRRHAHQWGVDASRIGILGFSAGGTVATGTALRGRDESRPDFVGSIYGVPDESTVPPDAPSLFVAATEDDPLVPANLAHNLHSAWQSAGRDSELVMYSAGGHGFGMQQSGTDSDQWITAFYHWLLRIHGLKAQQSNPVQVNQHQNEG